MKAILVAEDDTAIADVMSLLLSEEGYTVRVATAFAQINKELQKNDIGLIFLDLWLSGESGAVICKKIKKDPNLKQVPIVILSANTNIATIAKESSADDFLPKPFEMEDLLAKVKKYFKDK